MSMQMWRMVVKEKRPLHLKFGVALAISACGILYAFLTIKNKRKSRSNGEDKKSDSRGENEDELKQQNLDWCIPRIRSHSSISDRSSLGSRDGLLLPEFNEVLQECNMALTTATISPRKSKLQGGDEDEIETNCEELGIDTRIFNLKMESLVSHNRRLEAKLGDYGRLMAEFEAEKAKTNMLRMTLKAKAEQGMEEILTPRDRAMQLREQDDKGVQANHRNELEEQLEEMMESNQALKQENSELLHKLEYVQMLATSALETEELHELREESQRLRQRNEELMKEVERIQRERWSDIEEVVYLRWINACLRYELRNHKPIAGKTISGDITKMLSSKSEEKVKQIILETAYKDGSIDRRMDITDLDSDHGSSSHSCLTDSGERDDSSVDMVLADKSNHSSRTKVFSKLRKLLKGKGSSHNNQEPKPPTSLGRTVSLDNLPDGYSSYSDELVKSSRNSSSASSRRSFDLQRSYSRSQKSLSSNGSMRSSDVGSSAITRINSLTEVDEHDWPLEAQPHQDAKGELLKYAEALKNSRDKSFRRRSASFESH